MARLAVGISRGESEDGSGSESDFPEISELLAAREHRPAAAVRAEEKRKTASSPAKKVSKKTGSLMTKGGDGENSMEQRSATEKGMRKKRVLGPVADNPLLRPLSGNFPAEGKAKTKKKTLARGEDERAFEMGVRAVDSRARTGGRAGPPKTKPEASVRAKQFGSDSEKSKKAGTTKKMTFRKTVERIRSTPTPELKSDEEEVGIRRASQNTRRSKASSVVESDYETGYYDETVEKIEEGIVTRRKPIEKPMEKTYLNLPPTGDSDAEDQEVRATTTKGKGSRKSPAKPLSRSIPQLDSDVEDSLLYSDGMSDFVVDDDDSLEEEDTEIEVPPPKSVRKLVRGRKPRIDDSDEEDLELRMKNLTVERDSSSTLEKALKELDLEDSEDNISDKKPTKKPVEVNTKEPRQRKIIRPSATVLPSSDTEDRFTLR